MMFGFLHDCHLLLSLLPAFIYFLALKSITTIKLKSNVVQCIIFFLSPNQKMGKQRKKKQTNWLQLSVEWKPLCNNPFSTCKIQKINNCIRVSYFLMHIITGVFGNSDWIQRWKGFTSSVRYFDVNLYLKFG